MQCVLVWWAVVWGLVGAAGACSSSLSKRPARGGARVRPASTPPSTPPPQPPSPPPRANVTFPTQPCPPQYNDYYCLNGGSCFAVVISNSPIYNCECKDGFVGQRCEFKDLENSYVLTRGRLMMETASIAGGATVAVFLAMVVCVAAWVRLQRGPKLGDSALELATPCPQPLKCSPPVPPAPCRPPAPPC